MDYFICVISILKSIFIPNVSIHPHIHNIVFIHKPWKVLIDAEINFLHGISLSLQDVNFNHIKVLLSMYLNPLDGESIVLIMHLISDNN